MRKSFILAVLATAIVLAGPLIMRAAASFFVDENGYVGIKNSSPQHALDVSGAMYSRLVTATSSAIDWNKGNVQYLTLSSNQTLTFSGAQAGGEYKLIINQDNTGGRSITWPSPVLWSGGSAPTLTSLANGTDLASFTYDGSRYLATVALNLASTPLLNNLISYWKLDESSGNADDAAGSNTLTNQNSTPYASGKINNGVSLNGSTNYLSIPDGSQSGLSVTGSFTIALWVKVASQPSGTYVLATKRVSGSGYSFYYDNSGGNELSIEISNGSGTGYAAQSVTLSTGDWHHVAVSFDPSTHITAFYVDGSLIGSGTSVTQTSIGTNSADFSIGSMAGAYAFNGSLDEIGIWSRALSSTEITELYNSGNGHQYPF